MEPPNNGRVGAESFDHCSEVVPSSEVEMYGQYRGRELSIQSVHYRGFTVFCTLVYRCVCVCV